MKIKLIKYFIRIFLLILLITLMVGCSGNKSKIEMSNTDKKIDTIYSQNNENNNPEENITRDVENEQIKPFTWEEEIHGIHLLMTLDEVKNIMGNPLNEQKVNSEIEGKITILEYENLSLQFNKDLRNELTEIEIDKNGIITVRGIKIGDNVDVLNNKFYLEEIELSKGKKDIFEPDKANIYYYKDKDIYIITYYDVNYDYIALIFEVKDSKIIKATLIYQTV